MKFTKLCLMFTAATLAVGAFADARNVLVSFSTEADFYADGDKVADGEWYALCWSPRETFGGLTLDCTPVNQDEEVVILAPLAKDGRCPRVVFQIDSAVADKLGSDGYYFVYVLDTRTRVGDVVTAAPAKVVDGRRVPVTSVNGSQVATSGFSASSSVGGASRVTATANETNGATRADWGVVRPKITSFGVVAGRVNITVTGIVNGVDYTVRMGETPTTLKEYEGLPLSGFGTVEFNDLDPKDARFFDVIVK